jgi:pyruvate kinase
VKAIVALTESGTTTLWMSRVRSDIPIYAFTRQEITRRRVTLYRGVYPVAYDDIGQLIEGILFLDIPPIARKLNLVKEGDLVILTKGALSGVAGGTNSMQILQVTREVMPMSTEFRGTDRYIATEELMSRSTPRWCCRGRC